MANIGDDEEKGLFKEVVKEVEEEVEKGMGEVEVGVSIGLTHSGVWGTDPGPEMPDNVK